MNRVLVLFAAIVGLTLTLAITLAAFGLDVPSSLGLMYEGAFGSRAAWGRTAARMTPLLLCGLGMMIAWKAAMYNIGGEGQLLFGAMSAAILYKLLPSASGIGLTILLLLVSGLGGGLLAGTAAWLQVKRGVQVVISTILMNFIVLKLLEWLVSGPLQRTAGGVPQSEPLPASAMLWRPDRQFDLHAGLFLSLIIAALAGGWLYFTKSGFLVQLVGQNPRAARSAGYDGNKLQVLAMSLSGSLCGLAGGVQYTAMTGYVSPGLSDNWGFMGIPVALLGGLHPLGVVGAAAYFGALLAGSFKLSLSAAGPTVVLAVQSAALLGFLGIQAYLSNRKRSHGEES